MSLLKLSITSLEGVVFSEAVDMVVIPGIYGDMSLNSSGRDFVHLLTTGIIYVYKDSHVSHRFLIFAGSVLSQQQEVIISANQICINLDKVENNYFDKTIKKYEEMLVSASDKSEIVFFQKEINAYHKAKSLIDSHYYR